MLGALCWRTIHLAAVTAIMELDGPARDDAGATAIESKFATP